MKKLFTPVLLFLFLIGSIHAQQDSLVQTIIGNGNAGYSGDGGADTSAEINLVYGLCVDDSGNIYLDDWDNHVIRKVSKNTGIINTIAGNINNAGYSGDGGPAILAGIHSPYGMVLDSIGDIYFNDEFDYAVRKITAATGIITTVAGNGNPGYSGDGGPATSAEVDLPQTGITLDNAGNLYFGDFGNDCIRKVTKAGIISTIAGVGFGGYTGDGGPAISAELNSPTGMAFDSAYSILFFADQGNNVIRKIDMHTGIISTVVGIAGFGGYSGDGGPALNAEINDPIGIAISPNDGSLLIADANNNVLRRVDLATRIITTIVGDGTSGFNGDGSAPKATEFTHLNLIAFTPSGQPIIGDDFNYRIRELMVNDGTGVSQIQNNDELILYPNPATGNVCLTSGTEIKDGTIVTLFDIWGREVWSENISSPATTLNLDIHGLSAGTYFVKIMPSGNANTEVKKLVIIK